MCADPEARAATARPSRTALVLAFATIYLVWGSTYLGIRIAIASLPPFLMAGLRFLVSGVVLFAFLLGRGAAWPTARQWRDQAIVGLLLLLGSNAVVSWAELTTPSGIACLLLGGSPIVVVLMDWLRPGGQRPGFGLTIGVLVGVAGLALLLGPGAIPAGYRPSTLALLALLASSVLWWAGSLYGKHRAARTPLLMASALQMLCGSVSILLTSGLIGEWSGFHFAQVTARSWLAFSYLAGVGGVVVFPVYTWLLEHTTPAKLATFAYVNPVVAIFLGWALVGEPLNGRILVAAAVILGAVVLISAARQRTAVPK